VTALLDQLNVYYKIDIKNNVTKEQDKILQLEEQLAQNKSNRARENLKVLANEFSRGLAHTGEWSVPNHTNR